MTTKDPSNPGHTTVCTGFAQPYEAAFLFLLIGLWDLETG